MSQQAIAQKCLKTLEALGYGYVVRTPEREFISSGDFDVNALKPKTKREVKNTGVTAYLRKHGIDKLHNGVLDIPAGGFAPEVVRKTACSYASKYWGPNTYTSMVSDDTITIVRHG